MILFGKDVVVVVLSGECVCADGCESNTSSFYQQKLEIRFSAEVP